MDSSVILQPAARNLYSWTIVVRFRSQPSAPGRSRSGWRCTDRGALLTPSKTALSEQIGLPSLADRTIVIGNYLRLTA